MKPGSSAQTTDKQLNKINQTMQTCMCAPNEIGMFHTCVHCSFSGGVITNSRLIMRLYVLPENNFPSCISSLNSQFSAFSIFL